MITEPERRWGLRGDSRVQGAIEPGRRQQSRRGDRAQEAIAEPERPRARQAMWRSLRGDGAQEAFEPKAPGGVSKAQEAIEPERR